MAGARRAGGSASLSRLLGGLHVDLGDHRSSVFLAGSGRSGTTWVSGLINHRNAYRFVFEPFRQDKVGICENFGRKQYLRSGDRREEYLGPARTILTGGLRSLWTDRFNEKLVARRRLIKDIRANLLLGWMRANFPGMPIVLLLRHPCAVVASQLALGWRDVLSETMEQEELVEDFLTRPEHELQRLFSFLGEDFDERVYPLLDRPSPLSREGEAASVDAWQRSVTGRQLERAVEILGLFGLDRVYGEAPMPDPSGAHALMSLVRR
ncbi:MAG TPA: hypothetical protein VFT03_09325 [Rubrobacteraceae bacterium]|nr:hypothetical protein [Rubrobacteraceae bacterium]